MMNLQPSKPRQRRQARGSSNHRHALALSVLVLVAIVRTTRCQFQDQSSQEPQCKPQEPTKYDWERMNYYELLGLTEEARGKTKKKKKKPRKPGQEPPETERAAISNKEIRKAYRKQAQKYHPDKLVAKKKSSNQNKEGSGDGKTKKESSSESAVVTIEESNARFAKIAEAYEFLLDDEKRRDYDLFLEYCQNTEIVKDDEDHEGRLSTMIKKRFHGLFDDLVDRSRDPFKTFKEAFFGGDEGDQDDYFDPNDPFSHLRYESNPQRHPHHQEQYPDEEEPFDPQEDPVRVFNEQHTMYDPKTGENVIRVLQTEEYAPKASSSHSEKSTGSTRGGNSSSSPSFYYRIIAQDFQERYDPYNAKQVYVPITDPYLQEDGFRTASASRDQASKTSDDSSSYVESILHPWEVLTPHSPPIVSPNKRYIAGLTQDCELLVMLNPDRFGDGVPHYNDELPGILWSTQRPYGSNGLAKDHCFALLKGPHLVVTVGQHPHQVGIGGGGASSNRILWHSDGRSDEDDSKQGYYEYEDEYGFWHKRQRSYLAQLDNDGSLTVYSIWSVPEQEEERGSRSIGRGSSNSRSSLAQPQAMVSNMARAAKDLWHGRIPTKNEFDHLYSSSRSLTYKRCVYSTNAGNLPVVNLRCYRIPRRLHQLALETNLAIRQLVFRINAVADAWLDLLYEEDDIFYAIKESIWKNTFGSKMAGSSARWVRKFLEQLKQLSANLNKQ